MKSHYFPLLPSLGDCPRCLTPLAPAALPGWAECPQCLYTRQAPPPHPPAAAGGSAASPSSLSGAAPMMIYCPNCGYPSSSQPSATTPCAQCGYTGFPAHLIRFSTSGNGISNARAPALQASTPAGPDEDGDESADDARDELRQRVYDLAGDVCAALRELSDADWRLSLAGVYERLQDAHGALYQALGGTRMGAYRPARQAVEQAVVTLCLWEMVTLRAVERMREGE